MSESHTTVVSHSPCGNVGNWRATGILRSLRGSHAGTLTRVGKSLRESKGQTRRVPGITTSATCSD